MEKVYVKKFQQNGKIMYAGIIDPRKVADILPQVEPGEQQEAQRPYNRSRVKEIARYVAGQLRSGKKNVHSKGLLPNAPVVALQPPFRIEEEDNSGNLFFYIPVTEKEKSLYRGAFNPIDGQHRLFSFQEKYRDPNFKDSTKYEMLFSFVVAEDIRLKRELFLSINEKQKKGSPSELWEQKRALGIVSEYEELLSQVTDKLNEEDYSPLRGRIKIGGSNIKYGLNQAEIINIMDSSNVSHWVKLKLGNSPDRVEAFSRHLSDYLTAWSNHYDGALEKKPPVSMAKISGIRYLIFILPCIDAVLLKQKKKGTVENFAKIIESFHEAIEGLDLLDKSFTQSLSAGRTTKSIAEEHERKFRNYYKDPDEFDTMLGT